MRHFELHPWADDFDCSTDDEISDTPPQLTGYIGCPSHPAGSKCSNQEMFMNFMDYVDDNCMHMFTTGQAQKMHETLTKFRQGLIDENQVCKYTVETEKIDFSVFPNPSNGVFILDFDREINQLLNIELYNFTLNRIYQIKQFVGTHAEFNLSHLAGGVYYLSVNGAFKKVILLN